MIEFMTTYLPFYENYTLGTVLVLALTGNLMALIGLRKAKQLKRKQSLQSNKLEEDMLVLSKAAVGMGQKVLDTERKLNEVLKKQALMTNSQTDHPSYDQATKLIAMGATEQDLVNSCGYSHAEADLLMSLNRQLNQSAARTLQ